MKPIKYYNSLLTGIWVQAHSGLPFILTWQFLPLVGRTIRQERVVLPAADGLGKRVQILLAWFTTLYLLQVAMNWAIDIPFVLEQSIEHISTVLHRTPQAKIINNINYDLFDFPDAIDKSPEPGRDGFPIHDIEKLTKQKIIFFSCIFSLFKR